MDKQSSLAAAEARSLRSYAKQQGRLSRLYKDDIGVPYYREVQRGNRTVREPVDGAHLPEAERDRQRRFFVRKAQEARREANRKAKELEA